MKQLKKLNQKGIAPLEIVLILLVVLTLAGVGYYVWKQKSDSKPAATVSTTETAKTTEATEPKPAETKVEEVAYISVIQADGSVKSEVPSKVAKNDDQKAIIDAIYKTCKSPSTNIALNYKFPSDSGVFKQSGDHAWVNTSCYNPNLSLDEQGSGQGTYVRKTSGTWVVDGRSQMGYPGCSDVDGKSYPNSIVSECLLTDGSTRAPK